MLNAEDANPAQDLCDILIELGLSGNKIGVEYATYGLTAANGRAVDAALDGKFITVDASDLVRWQRLVKSSFNVSGPDSITPVVGTLGYGLL